MEDNFNLYDWNNKRRLAENKLDSISDMMSLNDKRVNAITKAIANEFGLEISPRLQGVIRVALADYMQEDLDIDQNINKDDEGSSFNITRGGDDPKMGAELESDANVVGESEFINHPRLAVNILKKNESDIIDIYKKYEGKGQSANREVRAEVIDLLMPDIVDLDLESDDEEKVFNFAKRGLASLEGAMLRKRTGL
jgi:hypothetical protein|tara:strand:+ start:122 stop:709 length:588 start_codon:yes stop_codon:yes gene_type:complete